MPTNNPPPQRKFFSAGREGEAAKALKSVFILRYHDNKSDSIQNKGPFSEKEALKLLSSYLKSGVCSWIVSYSG
jgi:hypothetical protein